MEGSRARRGTFLRAAGNGGTRREFGRRRARCCLRVSFRASAGFVDAGGRSGRHSDGRWDSLRGGNEVPAPRDSYEHTVVVPVSRALEAEAILESEMHNQEIEEKWRAHFATLSD